MYDQSPASGGAPDPPPNHLAVALPDPPGWRDRLVLLIDAVAADPGRAATIVALGLAAVLGSWVVLRGPAPPPVEETLPIVAGPTVAAPATEVAPRPVVHVAGAVVTPGLYELPPGARVADAVDAAGGAVGDADLHRLNLAAPVHDGQRIYVPRPDEEVPPEQTRSGAGDEVAVIDLNTATQAELETLPGVGPATAEAILAERARRGRFRSVDELLEVRGIGPAKLAAIRDRVRV